MIGTIKHKGLRRLHDKDDRSGIRADMVDKVQKILSALEAADSPEDMALPARQTTIDRVGAAPITISSIEDLDGLVVTAEILDFGDDGDRPVGRIIEILGRQDDFGVDVEITIRKFHLPHHFPAATLEEAQDVPAVIPSPESSKVLYACQVVSLS